MRSYETEFPIRSRLFFMAFSQRPICYPLVDGSARCQSCRTSSRGKSSRRRRISHHRLSFYPPVIPRQQIAHAAHNGGNYVLNPAIWSQKPGSTDSRIPCVQPLSPCAGSVRVRAGKYNLKPDRRPRWFRRLQGWPLRSQCDGGTGACGCWRKFVDEGGSGDGGGYAIHRSLDRTGQPIVGT